MKNFICIILAGNLFFCLACFGGQEPSPSQIEAVKTYIAKEEPLEFFKDLPRDPVIENAIIADIDNDGNNEVVLHTTPYYLQSPTIIIYKLSKKSDVSRVKEGLAPGPLVPISGVFLNSHPIDIGLDFDIKDKQDDPEAREKAIKIGLEYYNSVVAYKNFFHTDSRKGNKTFIDMSEAENSSEMQQCTDSEFSRVLQIAAGRIGEDKGHVYLAAWVKNYIYLYLIKNISKQGRLNKQLWIKQTPAGFHGFASGDVLSYQNAAGEWMPLDMKK